MRCVGQNERRIHKVQMRSAKCSDGFHGRVEVALREDETIQTIFDANDDAQLAIDDERQLILLKLGAGMRVSFKKAVQTYVMPETPDDKRTRKFRVIMPTAGNP